PELDNTSYVQRIGYAPPDKKYVVLVLKMISIRGTLFLYRLTKDNLNWIIPAMCNVLAMHLQTKNMLSWY
ncbi:hypothetical protein L1K70_23650, partial [Salmonella enterica subsp. enterica serovar Anatum]|nr:hypothetical protein [Salmonella enterica subsp. enterica serovar Anatum]